MSSAVTSAQQNAGAQQSKNKLLCKLMAQKNKQKKTKQLQQQQKTKIPPVCKGLSIHFPW